MKQTNKKARLDSYWLFPFPRGAIVSNRKQGNKACGCDRVNSKDFFFFFFPFEMAPWFENDSLLPLLICILRVRSFALCKSLDRNR